jgi:hypothetical protein
VHLKAPYDPKSEKVKDCSGPLWEFYFLL